jgi:hypothetical protein
MVKKSQPKTDKQNFNDFVNSLSYREKLLTVRPFFQQFSAKNGFNLRDAEQFTRAQKQQITKHFKAVLPYLGQPFTLAKVTSPEKASAAWRSIHGIEPPFDTRTVPIPESPASKPVLEYHYDENEPDDLRARVRMSGITAENFYFADYGLTNRALAKSLGGLDDLLSGIDPDDKNRYAILCGNHTFNNYSSRKKGKSAGTDNVVFLGDRTGVLNKIRALQNSYNNKKANNYWGNWLHGVKAYGFSPDTEQFRIYKEESKAARAEKFKTTLQIKRANKNLSNMRARAEAIPDKLKELKKDNWFYGKKEYERRLSRLEREQKAYVTKIPKAIQAREKLIESILKTKLGGK